MLSRVMLAILLLCSQFAALGAAMPASAPSVAAPEGCCPLCELISGADIGFSCGCGCGSVNPDPVPDAPSETPATLNLHPPLAAPVDGPARAFGLGLRPLPVASSSDRLDAFGHAQTHRFLAAIGHWLN